MYLTKPQIIEGRKLFIIWQQLYVWGNIPVKSSVCFSILRVSKNYIWISRVLYVLIFLITILSVATTTYVLALCKPLDALWDPTILDRPCYETESTYIVSVAYSAFNIAADFTAAFLPIFLLWQVNMRGQHKLIVIGVLSLGVFASVATLVRLKYLLNYISTSNYLCTSVRPSFVSPILLLALFKLILISRRAWVYYHVVRYRNRTSPDRRLPHSPAAPLPSAIHIPSPAATHRPETAPSKQREPVLPGAWLELLHVRDRWPTHQTVVLWDEIKVLGHRGNHDHSGNVNQRCHHADKY